jgi:hypothetical protein
MKDSVWAPPIPATADCSASTGSMRIAPPLASTSENSGWSRARAAGFVRGQPLVGDELPAVRADPPEPDGVRVELGGDVGDDGRSEGLEGAQHRT